MYTVWNAHFCFVTEFGVHNHDISFCASLNYRVVLLENTPLAQKQEHFFQNSPVLNILCTKDAFLRTRYQLKTLLYRFSDMLAPYLPSLGILWHLQEAVRNLHYQTELIDL